MRHTSELLLASLSLVAAHWVAAAPLLFSTDGQEATDTATGLIWRRCPEGTTWNINACAGTALGFTHEAALIRAAQQAASTTTAWRLPNIKELISITNPNDNPAGFFESTNPQYVYWSSTPEVNRVGQCAFFGCAWYAFTNGSAEYFFRSDLHQVRLVRSGPN